MYKTFTTPRTFSIPVTVYDTALVPETLLVYDTIIEEREVKVSVYIVVDPATSAQTVVSENARAVDGANGVLLEGLTPGQLFAVYSTDGALVVRGVAPAGGSCLLRDLAAGTYILWQGGRWGKFGH